MPLSGAKPCARSTSMPVCTGGRGARAGAAPAAPKSRPVMRRARAASGGGVGERRRHDRRHARAKRRHVAPAVGMHAVRQEHDEHPRRRIDPERRAGEAGVAERAERQQLAAVGRERRVDVPAEAAHVRIAGRARRRRHPRDRQRREHARAVAARRRRAACGEDREVGRRAEEARVAGDAAHPPRGRVVHDAAQHLHVGPVARPAVRRALLRRRDARPRAPPAAVNIVSLMPSGSKMCCFANSSSGRPLTRSTMSPSRK